MTIGKKMDPYFVDDGLRDLILYYLLVLYQLLIIKIHSKRQPVHTGTLFIDTSLNIP